MGINVTNKTVQANRRLGYRVVKRLIDIIASLIGLIVLLPVFLVVALLIYKEDGENVIFCQDRSGLNNKTFKMYKFRSMIANAPAMRAEMEKYNELDGPAFKMKDDPRITKIGAFIRKTSIDELPQLINVLKYGGNYDKILKKLAQITELNVKDIEKIFESVAKENQYFAKQFYDYRNIKFIPYEQNISLQNQVKAIAKINFSI